MSRPGPALVAVYGIVVATAGGLVVLAAWGAWHLL